MCGLEQSSHFNKKCPGLKKSLKEDLGNKENLDKSLQTRIAQMEASIKHAFAAMNEFRVDMAKLKLSNSVTKT
jgi:hypothetical protein